MLRRDNLHDYQVRGVNHIIENECAVLFLDCGMGKSATTLTAIKELIDSCIISNVLIIAPKRVAEVTWKDDEGHSQSYDPPRYDIDYDVYVTIHVNSPYFNEIAFKVNDYRIEERNSVEYREAERQAQQIREALTQLRETVREQAAAAAAPKTAQTCPFCGATTIPDAQGRCEYCGGAMR